jgi:hypothetical protein
MAESAKSISISQLSDAAHKAATAAVKKAQITTGNAERGLLYQYPWIIGIVFRDPDPQDYGKYVTVSEKVTDELARLELNPQPLPPRRLPSTYIYDHVIICGYRPVDEEPVLLD